MKVLLMIFGGLADRPAPELAGKTPLEAAYTPNMDRLARNGITGLFHPLKPGYAVGSPLAVHLMFGYAEELYPNRGPLLAVARGLQFRGAEVALAARLSSGCAGKRKDTLGTAVYPQRRGGLPSVGDGCVSLVGG